MSMAHLIRKWARIALPLISLLVGAPRADVAAAGDPSSKSEGTPITARSEIEEIPWELMQLRGQDDKAIDALRENPGIRFEAGRVELFGGCNRLTGLYQIDRDRLTIEPLAGTIMACPDAAMAIEDAFKGALTSPLRFVVADGKLMLFAASDTDPTLVFEAAAPPVLEGITWEVTGYNNGRHAVVSPIVGTGATLTLTFENGSVVGHAGCNRFRSTYAREGNGLAIGPAVATRMSCEDEGIMDQERQFLAALESTKTWTIDGGMLDLHRADGERALTAVRGGE